MNLLNRYRLMVMLTLAAYAWVVFCFFNSGFFQAHYGINPCLIKTATGFPCPSCGTTRSVMLILHGNLYDALFLNPLGYFAFFLLIALPFVFLYDAIMRKTLLLRLITKSEEIICNRKVVPVLVLFFLLLWGWNIHNGL
ncbi:MAG: DUF2752 domain-containing protein [Bacteroidia bacterium]|nr:DUF2752 domain-containing protein [Bacteroidia bacterium]